VTPPPPAPPSFVPPPEVSVPAPAPAITATPEPPPAAPVTVAPPPTVLPPPAPPPAVAAPAKPAARPARIDFASCARPDYPAAARRANVEGITRIRFTIDASGAVVKAEVERASGTSREHRLLDRTAVEALSACRFQPGADEDGRPVGATSVVEYAWRLE
jgi:protein TonB